MKTLLVFLFLILPCIAFGQVTQMQVDTRASTTAWDTTTVNAYASFEVAGTLSSGDTLWVAINGKEGAGSIYPIVYQDSPLAFPFMNVRTINTLGTRTLQRRIAIAK